MWVSDNNPIKYSFQVTENLVNYTLGVEILNSIKQVI